MRSPLALACRTAEEAGRLLMARFGGARRVRSKGVGDIVTAADRASERLIRSRLRAAFPAIPVLGEEQGGPRDFDRVDRLWVVDPLDGTVNFAHGYPVFSVSIALVERGAPVAGVVHDPTRGESFCAERGRGAGRPGERLAVSGRRALGAALLSTGFAYQGGSKLARSLRRFGRLQHATRALRRPGSAAIDLAYVAAGRFDGFWEEGLNPWDVAAGILLVEEAGGRVTDYQGRPFRLDSPAILASNGRLHVAIRDRLKEPGS